MIHFSGKVRRLALGLLLLAPALAQTRRDPLNPLEQDQLRDAAQEPADRLKLYIQFSRARLSSLEQMRADPKVTDRAQQTRDQLQDFLDVYDELNDNIDTFVERKADLRKPLKAVIEADTEFQAKLPHAILERPHPGLIAQSHVAVLLRRCRTGALRKPLAIGAEDQGKVGEEGRGSGQREKAGGVHGVPTCRQAQSRCGLWPLSPGTPQKISVERTSSAGRTDDGTAIVKYRPSSAVRFGTPVNCCAPDLLPPMMSVRTLPSGISNA